MKILTLSGIYILNIIVGPLYYNKVLVIGDHCILIFSTSGKWPVEPVTCHPKEFQSSKTSAK